MVRTIDWQSDERGAELAKSFYDTGFAIIKNHGIAGSIIHGAYAEWSDFFERFSDEYKNKFLFNKDDQAGYFPMNSESAKDSSIPDIKEFYHYYPWANNPNFINTEMLRLSLTELGLKLLIQLERNTPEEITSLTSEPWCAMPIDAKRTLFRIIHYPPLTGNEPEGAVRAAAHGDINLLTLLPMATAEGLQVKDLGGCWHDVKCDDPNSIVVNLGDMLELASGGYYNSTIHRVVNPNDTASRRYSMPLFLHPRCDVRLTAEKTANEFLMERLRELGLI